jgi:hypothetical protein
VLEKNTVQDDVGDEVRGDGTQTRTDTRVIVGSSPQGVD